MTAVDEHLHADGPNGGFVIEGWPREGGIIAAFHPDYAPTSLAADSGTRVRIVLQAACGVRGNDRLVDGSPP